MTFSNEGSRIFDAFNNIMTAEKAIKEEWRDYERDTGNPGVESGTIRCSFELGPMIAQLTESTRYNRLASKLHECILHDNVWFSKITLSSGVGDGFMYAGRHDAREKYRQLTTAVFNSERRSPRRASTALYSDRGIYLRDGK